MSAATDRNTGLTPDRDALTPVVSGAILVVGAGGKITGSNVRARALFGYGEADLTNLAFGELVQPPVETETPAWVESLDRGRTSSAREQTYPVRGRCRDGSAFDADVLITPMSFEQRSGFIATFGEASVRSHQRLRGFGQEQRWRTLLEQLGDTLFFWDFGDDWVEFSRHWLDFMGYEPDELATGSAWFELLHPEDRERVERETHACITGASERFEIEFRLRRKSGDFRWIRSSARIVDWASDGDGSMMVGFYRDTTAKREAQDELRHAETRWEHALNGSELGVWDWNLVTDKVFFSAEWKRMIGFEQGELEPNIETWRTLALPEDLAASDAAIAAYLAGETEEYRAECRVRTKDGGLKWILDRGKVVDWSPDGTPRRMIGTHDDITKTRLREAELHESRERLRRIASLIPGVVFQFELSPDGTMRFPYASEGIRKIYGVAPEDVVADAGAAFDRIHRQDVDKVEQSIARSAADLSPWDTQYRVVDDDGTERWVHGVANPRRAPGGDGTVLWHGYISDITERKRTSLALQQRSRALQLANDDLEQFNYIAAHDLKEPLRSIRHLCEWIEDDLPADVNESVHTNFERLRARTERLGALVEGLALYSQAGRRDANLVPVQPLTLARGLAQDIELQGCAITFDGDEDEAIVTSEVALLTVLRNLITNAVLHHDDPAHGRLRVAIETGAVWLSISVEDDGPGIDPVHHERVFRMYQRLDPEAGKPGSGSGLAIVKRIINSIGSRIEIESPISNRGTRFRFDWPREWPQN